MKSLPTVQVRTIVRVGNGILAHRFPRQLDLDGEWYAAGQAPASLGAIPPPWQE